MMQRLITFLGGPIFDGKRLRQGYAAQFRAGQLAKMVPLTELGERGDMIDLGGDILSPGYVDLQVNGGGGVMLGDAPNVETIATICDAHRSLHRTAPLQGAALALPAGPSTTRHGLVGSTASPGRVEQWLADSCPHDKTTS